MFFSKPVKRRKAVENMGTEVESVGISDEEMAANLQEIVNDPNRFGNRPREDRVRVIAEQMWLSPLIRGTVDVPPIHPNPDQLLPGM